MAWDTLREKFMKMTEVTMVRVYIMEASKALNPIVNYLHNNAEVRGISVFRVISGFGETGDPIF